MEFNEWVYITGNSLGKFNVFQLLTKNEVLYFHSNSYITVTTGKLLLINLSYCLH